MIQAVVIGSSSAVLLLVLVAFGNMLLRSETWARYITTWRQMPDEDKDMARIIAVFVVAYGMLIVVVR